MKDYWNRSLPAFDQQFAQFIGNPFFATGILNGVYKVPVPPAPRAAKGEYKAAIASYEKAQASTPMPDYAAALYDLYTIQKDPKNAQRNLALIFADHDWHLDRALELATGELDVRKDIYSYDALAWALYKNKKFAEADGAMAKALKMGTPEPAFYYHAEQIASRYANRFISIVVSSAGSPDDGPELDRRAAK
jgi:tetratricopeptide (TPR) repeat protein